LSGCGFDRESGGAPFRQAAVEATGAPTALSQQLDGLIRVDAVRSPTVRDELLARRQALLALMQFIDRDGQRARNVTGGEFVHGAGIENHHVIAACQRQQIVHGHRFGQCVS